MGKVVLLRILQILLEIIVKKFLHSLNFQKKGLIALLSRIGQSKLIKVSKAIIVESYLENKMILKYWFQTPDADMNYEGSQLNFVELKVVR
ncbi:hypothetical protein ABEB36_013832 [Hypothenemus hampei]|uniref:Uncharacterized protein n=1 Tax=Hypothenemus hampei TaxID=57062 RepID=A0ABD1E5S1_HYPHA